MANYLVTDTELISIANAIRDKSGTTATLSYPTEYITAINNIKTGGDKIWACIHVEYPTGSTCTATNGSIILTAPDTSGEVIFGISEPNNVPENWTISCTDGIENDSTTISIQSYGSIKYITLLYTRIYGVEWDGSSSTNWTRTDQAALFSDPIPYVSGSSNYGSPFDNIAPWKDMIRITDSVVGEMVKIPKFWYKLTQNGNKIKIQISNKNIDGYSVCPACMNRNDGNGEHDYILLSRYHCATSSYKSISNVKPAASGTRATFSTAIHTLGEKVYMWDWATMFTVWLLYLVEFANWNSQSKIGYGCGNGSSTGNMGYTDNMPYHTGTTQTNRTTFGLGTQYRYIEGLWDNVCDWLEGCKYIGWHGYAKLMLTLDLTRASGWTYVNEFNTAEDIIPSGIPTKLTVKNITNLFPLFYSSAGGGTTSTYTCDSWGSSYSAEEICTGGFYAKYDTVGLFCFYPNTTSYAAADTGARLIKFP